VWPLGGVDPELGRLTSGRRGPHFLPTFDPKAAFGNLTPARLPLTIAMLLGASAATEVRAGETSSGKVLPLAPAAAFPDRLT